MVIEKINIISSNQNNHLLIRFFSCLLGIFLLLLALEFGLRWAIKATSLAEQPIEIQTPANLYAKIDHMMHKPGKHIALIGDSLILGKSMTNAGIREWWMENLSAKLNSIFAKTGHNIFIDNYGMNGVVPADLVSLVDALISVRVDAVIMDVSLRSFSGDFMSADTMNSRPWLRDFHISPNGYLTTSGIGNRFDNEIFTFLINNSYAYRFRDQVREFMFGGEPASRIQEMRDKFNELFLRKIDVTSEVELLFLAKSRYSSINLSDRNPQLIAMEYLIDQLSKHHIPTIVFYATERPSILSSIIEPAVYHKDVSRLNQIIAQHAGEAITYIGPLVSLVDQDFIDHVHVLPSGYEKYAGVIAPKLLEKIQ